MALYLKYCLVILGSLWVSVISVGISSADQHAPVPHIVVTIKPLHGLVSLITKNVLDPQLLITDPMAAHHFRVKPSMVKMLERADAIFWIGQNQEVSLVRVLNKLSQKAHMRVVSVTQTPDLLLLPLRETQSALGSQKSGVHKIISPDSMNIDQHIWLHFGNAKLILKAIAGELISISPHYEDEYRQNLNNALAIISDLENELKSDADVLSEVNYGVLHDAFQYLEMDLGLNNPLIMEARLGLGLSARMMQDLQTRLKENAISCVLAEPEMQHAPILKMTQKFGIKTLLLDPIGSSLEPGVEHYSNLMRAHIEVFNQCQ